MSKLKDITLLIKTLPGISLKTAERLAISLIEDKEVNIKILNEVISFRGKIWIK